MTDVFISYSRQDATRAKVMAQELQSRGLEVWWDTHLKAGAEFRAEISEKLEAARAVIVIWSEESVASRFVCDEADVGAQKDTLFPVLVDLVDIPLGFRQIQTADLTKWRGKTHDRQLQSFLDIIENVCGGRRTLGGNVAKVKEPVSTDAPEPLQAPKPAKRKAPKRKKASRSLMMTGQRARLTLILRSLALAILVAGGFGALAGVTDFVLPELRTYLIGGLGVLVFITRYMTFQADRKSGGASLHLLSRSYMALFFFALIASAPFLLEGRLYAAMMQAVRMEGIEGADINGVTFDAKGERLVTSSDDASVRVWDAKTGVQLSTFDEHDNWVWAASFSPDGEHVVSASRDLTARVWNAATGKEILVLKGHRASVRDAVYDPKGRFIATASNDRTIKLWDPVSGEERRSLSGHQDRVTSIAISRDGALLASASYDGTVRLWNTANGRLLSTLGASGKLNDVAFSPRGVKVAAVNEGGTAFVWNVASRQRMARFSDHGKLFAVEFVNEGQQIATGGLDGVVRIWDFSRGKIASELGGHEGGVRSLDLSGDGLTLVSGSRDNTARVWDVASGSEVQIMGHVTPAIALPVALDQPPLFIASRAPVPVDLLGNREAASGYAAKGFGIAAALLALGLVLRALLSLLRQYKAARAAVAASLGIVALYVLALMLSAFPVEASFLWLTLAFVPMTILAIARWLITLVLRRGT
jgi:TIR domain-containing protein/WD40 domain-containing protein